MNAIPLSAEPFDVFSTTLSNCLRTTFKHGHWLLLLTILAIWPFAKELCSDSLVLSSQSTDVAHQFLFSRAFGFGEMSLGNFPLWNPYSYGGTPYLGQFQSALLYPLNLLFLVLPLERAINVSFVLHVLIFGVGMYAWAAHAGLKPAAAFVSGAAAMFCGSFFLHIYAGHLSNICSMAWVPWIFLGIDGWLAKRHAIWLLLAAGAVALQVYAGHPQYVYYTAVVAGAYSLAFLIGAPRPAVAVAGLLVVYPLAALLSAAQLLPGLAGSAESVRAGGAAYEFASMFALPPENFLTLLAPDFFGNMRSVPYWGRCYLWEMNLYAGAGMLLLALHALIRMENQGLRRRLLALLGLVVLLAIIARSPLYTILYHAVPGFSSFRGTSKFLLFGALFLAMFAGYGMDLLLRRRLPGWGFCIGILVLGAVLRFVGFFIGSGSADWWAFFRQALGVSSESYLLPVALSQAGMISAARELSAHSIMWTGALFLFFGFLFLAVRYWPAATWLLLFAAVADIFFHAKGTVSSFDINSATYPEVAKFLEQHPGDHRTMNLFNPDSAMLLQSENIWGYDPSVLKRYAELLFLSQGQDPETAGQNLKFHQSHPLLDLVRCRYAMEETAPDKIKISPVTEDAFPRFFVASRYKVEPDRKSMFEDLRNPSFDPKVTVLLEEEPVPRPEKKAARFKLRLISSTTNQWTLEILTAEATLLVMTDAWSKDWKAVSLPGSVQLTYDLLPAYHALRAIPLAGGRHLLKIEYVPSGFYLGIWLSLLSLSAVGVCLSVPKLRRHLFMAHEFRWKNLGKAHGTTDFTD